MTGREATTYAPIIGPMREGESRYRDLPLLARCRECRTPITPLEVWSVVSDGLLRSGLCQSCAETPPAREAT